MTTDDEIRDLLYDAIYGWPEDQRDAALEWLAQREAAFQLVKRIEAKGLSALLE